jgi:FMN phosphatase YigB (HAD superfamily)
MDYRTREKFIIGCDVDGVLADFNTAYRQRLIDVTGRELIPPFVNGHEPTVWNYATDEYGYTKEEDNAVWKSITNDPFFWQDLEQYPTAAAFVWSVLRLFDNVYFITTRPGYMVKPQTEKWLKDLGRNNATVLIAKNAKAKGYLAAGLGLTHFIDDRDQNCYAVMHYSPDTQVYMLRHKYNSSVIDAHDMIIKGDLWRINNTDDPGSVGKPPIIIDSLEQFTEVLYGPRDAKSAA